MTLWVKTPEVFGLTSAGIFIFNKNRISRIYLMKHVIAGKDKANIKIKTSIMKSYRFLTKIVSPGVSNICQQKFCHVHFHFFSNKLTVNRSYIRNILKYSEWRLDGYFCTKLTRNEIKKNKNIYSRRKHAAPIKNNVNLLESAREENLLIPAKRNDLTRMFSG